MKTEVSNSLILQAHKEASRQVAEQLEKECPELFKPKFKVGDWVQFSCDSHIKRVEQLIPRVLFSDESHASKGFMEDFASDYRLATSSEIEQFLIKEAEKKGIKGGVKLTSVYSNYENGVVKTEYRHEYKASEDKFWYHNLLVYAKGKWATILSEPKVIELTLEDIAKLKGVDVSLIKIVK